MTDPAAIDLEATRKWAARASGPAPAYVENLIAAVEALRERVAEYDSLFDLAATRERPWIEKWRQDTGKHGTLPDYGKLLAWLCDRAQAAEARVAELASAIDELVNAPDFIESGLAMIVVRDALASTPAEALERARAKDEVIRTAKHFINNGRMVGDKEFTEALANLDALQPTEGPPLCEGCGKFPADPPSGLCPGCQAYQEHQS